MARLNRRNSITHLLGLGILFHYSIQKLHKSLVLCAIWIGKLQYGSRRDASHKPGWNICVYISVVCAYIHVWQLGLRLVSKIELKLLLKLLLLLTLVSHCSLIVDSYSVGMSTNVLFASAETCSVYSTWMPLCPNSVNLHTLESFSWLKWKSGYVGLNYRTLQVYWSFQMSFYLHCRTCLFMCLLKNSIICILHHTKSCRL